MKRAGMVLWCIAWLLTAGGSAFAQRGPSLAFPGQPVKIVVPFTAGSNTDILARVLADHLGAMWKQTVIVENKPGISGTVSVANSAPDGTTLLLTSNGHTVIGALNKGLSIDPVRDFSGVTQIASIRLVLVVPPSLPARTLTELVDLARKNPGKLNFTSAGLGSSNYIAGEIFKQTAKIDIVHVPYRGSQEQLTAIMRGDAQINLAFPVTAQGLIQSGQVRAIAFAAPGRSPAFPDVPTFAEAGMPQFDYDSWFGILAPARTPAAVLAKVSGDVATVLKTADVRQRWQTLGAVPVANTPAQFDAIVRADAERYGRILKAAGVSQN